MKILVDAMGGDNAPLCVLQGASQAAAEFGDSMELVLLGEEDAIKDCAAQNKIDLAPFTIINCTENIDMHDDPVKAVRHKKDSSLVKGLTMLKNDEADAFVSAGSTGALHVGTSLIVRTIKGRVPLRNAERLRHHGQRLRREGHGPHRPQSCAGQ